jgi:hypothetical protein
VASADRTLSGVRPAVFLALLFFAGCGSSEPRHAATTPAQPDNVFTIPAELPPPEKTPARKPRPKATPDPAPAAGAPTDAEVQQELAEALGVSGDAAIDQAGLTEEGLATVPPGAPAEVRAIIVAANKVAKLPYRYGGGHGGVPGPETWVDTAYDCSGSMSFALASAGLLDSPMTSVGFMAWGKPGPGRWVTTFANDGHAFMVVAGLRFDTVERARTGTRWGRAPTTSAGFTVRHPAGL